MRREGFEALADGALLLTLLLIASSVVLAIGTGDRRLQEDHLRYAEETRLALFRTTLDGLFYESGGEIVPIPNGTTVETLLRLQVHLVGIDPGAPDFDVANGRVLETASRLVRLGHRIAILGGVVGAPDSLRLPGDVAIPAEHFASHWTYPPLDGGPGKVRLSLCLWLSPLR